MTIQQSTSGDWILSASTEARAEDVAKALAEMEASDEFQAGPEQAIKTAIHELISVTSRPVSIDEAGGLAYVQALCRAMWEYPIDVVELACQNWRRVPNQGKWWPTEQDLRIQCETIAKPRTDLRNAAKRLLSALRNVEDKPKSTRSLQPYGRTKAFVERVREAEHLGQPFVRSYLSDMTCDFTEDTVFVAYLTQLERIPQRCAGILRDFPGLKLRLDKQTTQRCNRDQDAMGNTWKAPEPKKFKQKWGNG